jgi:hypothetical protein
MANVAAIRVVRQRGLPVEQLAAAVPVVAATGGLRDEVAVIGKVPERPSVTVMASVIMTVMVAG